jgi:hypothetical protein
MNQPLPPQPKPVANPGSVPKNTYLKRITEKLSSIQPQEEVPNATQAR